jgi:hypothetical protein
VSASFYKWDEQPGLGTTVAVSVFLHIIILVALFLFANSRSSKKFTAPVYTVDLFTPVRPAEIPAKVSIVEEQAKSPVEVESKKVAPRPITREKVVSLKKEKKPSLDEALKKIQQRVKKRETEETISKTMQELENKQLAKRIKEIREKVKHREGIVRPIKSEIKNHKMTQRGVVMKWTEDLEEKYAKLIGDLIQDEWNYVGDIKKDESAVIGVRIDRTGRLVESHIEQASSNTRLVQSGVRAIEKAASLFPPLPQELGKDFVEIGVCFPECERE